MSEQALKSPTIVVGTITAQVSPDEVFVSFHPSDGAADFDLELKLLLAKAVVAQWQIVVESLEGELSTKAPAQQTAGNA